MNRVKITQFWTCKLLSCLPIHKQCCCLNFGFSFFKKLLSAQILFYFFKLCKTDFFLKSVQKSLTASRWVKMSFRKRIFFFRVIVVSGDSETLWIRVRELSADAETVFTCPARLTVTQQNLIGLCNPVRRPGFFQQHEIFNHISQFLFF